MIPAVAQTLANMLVAGTSLADVRQIDFSHPSVRQETKPLLNLYFYGIQDSKLTPSLRQFSHPSSGLETIKPRTQSLAWFDVLFLLIAQDHTTLGEQRLLSEVLTLLLRYPVIPEECLVPVLRGYGALPIGVSAVRLSDAAALWNALRVPLRPSLHLAVTAPLVIGEESLPFSQTEVLSTSL